MISVHLTNLTGLAITSDQNVKINLVSVTEILKLPETFAEISKLPKLKNFYCRNGKKIFDVLKLIYLDYGLVKVVSENPNISRVVVEPNQLKLTQDLVSKNPFFHVVKRVKSKHWISVFKSD